MVGLGIAAGLAALGGLLGTGATLYNNQKNREFNASEAAKQRAWEEHMSNTAYQRSVSDMEQAGINPAMVLGNSAGGASTPSGATANSAGANMAIENLGSILNGASSMVNAFNTDNNKSNDINLKQALAMISNVADILK